MIRNKTIPALVVLLSLAAIASITLLQTRAGDGRDAQLKLAILKTELTRLQMRAVQGQRSHRRVTRASPAS